MKSGREIFTRDNALHIPLGAAIGGLVWLAGLMPDPWSVPGAGTVFLYLREVTQRQVRERLPFWRGWRLGLHHTMEWAAPGAVLFLAAALWKIF